MSEPQFVRARSVDHAIDTLKAAGGDGLIVAGGVVVSSLFNQRLASPAVLVDISRIKGLRYIKRTPNGLSIGALATHDDIHRSADVKAVAPLLTEIAEDVSCPRLRNRGTLGGSICTIGGQGDPATGLIALGATMQIKGPGGERTAHIEDFYKDAFEVDLAPDEIVERIDVPAPQTGARFAFCKLGPRNAMDFTQITVSVVMAPTGSGIRIGMNGVANAPNRPRATEALIATMNAGSINWTAVGKTLNGEISPQGDLVYSEDFKRHLALIGLRRAVERALARSKEAGGRA
ncbi:MAG: FAD binding domain-containing protein [Bradyrhizobiaceae bacterium]|nr:FAD binding domain-containing protein [Bradyrhizobiaceae bacterium]